MFGIFPATGSFSCHRSRRVALHFRRPANCNRRVLVFSGRGGDTSSGSAGLGYKVVGNILLCPISHDDQYHGDAWIFWLRFQCARAHDGKPAHAMARKASFGGLMVPAGGLQINGAGKIYDPGGIHVVAVDDVSLSIAPGEFCVVVGPSGCGKTTLLNAIAGFDRLTSGSIAMDGELLASPGKKLLPGPDRMVVFQHGALFPWKTVLWNVTSGPVKRGQSRMAEAADKGARADEPGWASGH